MNCIINSRDALKFNSALISPKTGRRFPVNKGIPNMLLHEDEV